MPDIDAHVGQLKRRAADAARERVRAEHQQEVARAHVEETEQALREEFGVSPAEVPALAAKLETDLEAEAKLAEAWLDKAEGRA